jgi:glucose/arabinose dehydrogenase
LGRYCFGSGLTDVEKMTVINRQIPAGSPMTIFFHVRTGAVLLSPTLLPIVAMLAFDSASFAATEDTPNSEPKAQACAGDNGGITLPPGFRATVLADNIGHARHLVVAPNGVLYVNTWSGTY